MPLSFLEIGVKHKRSNDDTLLSKYDWNILKVDQNLQAVLHTELVGALLNNLIVDNLSDDTVRLLRSHQPCTAENILIVFPVVDLGYVPVKQREIWFDDFPENSEEFDCQSAHF